MRQVEAAGDLLARISRRRAGGGVGERIGHRKAMLSDNEAAGGQMPPRVGISQFGGEKAGEQNGRERNEQHREPARN